MIKLLIADDEMLVLVGLTSMLDWNALGIEIAGTAHNGSQTLELIGSLRPDIVLADISMPVKNGLDAARESREKYGKLPVFLFLTSYEDFSFAREAVRLQAVDYLVKISLTPGQLEAAVKKAVQAVQEIKAHETGPEQPAARSGTQTLFRDRFFLQLFNGAFPDPAALLEQAAELGVQFDSARYAVVICETVLKQNRPLSAEARTRLYTSTLQTAEGITAKYCPCYVTGLDIKHFAVTLLLPSPETGQYKDTVRPVLAKLREVVFSYFSVDLYCTVGIPVSSPADISVSYRSASDISAQAAEQTPVVFACAENNTSYRDRVIAQVQEYIRSNISRRLSLNDIAGVFGFTPNYLSRLFTKSGGTGFVEYVTQEKIAAAKKLLRADSGLLVYELADRLGFESAFYFSTVFKKVEGCSPSEYRDALISEQP
jgi:two-component system, response regulator YesN